MILKSMVFHHSVSSSTRFPCLSLSQAFHCIFFLQKRMHSFTTILLSHPPNCSAALSWCRFLNAITKQSCSKSSASDGLPVILVQIVNMALLYCSYNQAWAFASPVQAFFTAAFCMSITCSKQFS